MSTPAHAQPYGDQDRHPPVGQAPASLNDALRVFLAERTRLLGIAYRIVGDSAQAEDVVQEAWMRWQRADRQQIQNPAAFLTTATTHLAINLIQSARCRHELPTEPSSAWLGVFLDPTDHVERAAAIERMLGFLMAKLNPAELAAFLLRKCFDYPYGDIAGVLDTSACNARQLVRRSHLSLTSSRLRQVDIGTHRRLVAAFDAATGAGDLDALVNQLVDGVRKMPCPATDKPDTSPLLHRRRLPAPRQEPPGVVDRDLGGANGALALATEALT